MNKATKEKPVQVAMSLPLNETESAIDFKPRAFGTDKVHLSMPTDAPQESDDTPNDVSDQEWDDLLMSPKSTDMLIEMANKAMRDFESGRTTPLSAIKK